MTTAPSGAAQRRTPDLPPERGPASRRHRPLTASRRASRAGIAFVSPTFVVVLVWRVALSPQYGIVNDWGRRLFGWDDPIAFLSTREYDVSLLGAHFSIPLALLTVIAFECWRYFPFAFLFILARLQAVPDT